MIENNLGNEGTNNKVCIYFCPVTEYPEKAPFNPPMEFPEYPFKGRGVNLGNQVYESIREMFKLMGMDIKNYGSELWNPFGEVIMPGDKVVIKPALTTDVNYTGDTVFSIIPHGSIIRAVLDYVLIAKPSSVIICDGPIPNAAFADVSRIVRLPEIVSFVNANQKTKVELIDLRHEYAPKDEKGHVIDIIKTKEDPLGYSIIDLGNESLLNEISEDWMKYRSVSSIKFERFAPPLYHNRENNIYSVSNTILSGNVIINIPKLKTHRKVGISATIKNGVGITNKKFWLPHFREGIDETRYSLKKKWKRHFYRLGERIQCLFFKYFGNKETVRGLPTVDGNWPGNDTTWRSAIDLYRILLYADKKGVMRNERQRKHFSLVDGIIGGENFGPLAPTEKKAGILICGVNPVSVDAVAAKVMGFDPLYIKMIYNCKNIGKFRLSEIDAPEINEISNKKINNLHFIAPFQWKGCLKKREGKYRRQTE